MVGNNLIKDTIQVALATRDGGRRGEAASW